MPRALTLLLVLLAMLIPACSDDDSAAALRDVFVSGGVTAEEAQCIVDTLGEEQAEVVVQGIDQDAPFETTDIAELTDTLEECGVNL